MQKALYPISYLLLLTAFACNNKVAIDNIKTAPEFSEEDRAFANVYQALDGVWKGKFKIYEDSILKDLDGVDLYNIKKENFEASSLKLINQIEVRQEYSFESPYFQKVKIIDTYPNEDKQEISFGVNKIQNGQMWCVVHKPGETVIHKGKTAGKHSIIWQRSEQKPQKIEYFKEIVFQNTYEIMGWGYYEGDDPQKSPRLCFYAEYERQ